MPNKQAQLGTKEKKAVSKISSSIRGMKIYKIFNPLMSRNKRAAINSSLEALKNLKKNIKHKGIINQADVNNAKHTLNSSMGLLNEEKKSSFSIFKHKILGLSTKSRSISNKAQRIITKSLDKISKLNNKKGYDYN